MGSSWFDDEARSLNNSLDEYAEWFEIHPQVTKPNFAPQPDRSRPICPVRLVFEREGKAIKLGFEHMEVASRNPTMTGLACEIPYAIGRGDYLRHLDSGETFEITKATPDGLSGIAFETVQVGRKAS